MNLVCTRRQAILGAAALSTAGICAAAPGHPPAALIDVHHHILPPNYVKAKRAEIAARSRGYTQVLEWTPQKSLADMDAAGTRTAILSMSMPVSFGDPVEARALARDANAYAASLVRQFPGRFGTFAALPLPDIDGAIAEAAYGLDILGADGVGLLSNYGGEYLGASRFEPLFAELDRRAALVYVHPTVAACCVNLVPDVPAPFLELPYDTTRTISSLLYSGALSRYRRIGWIFSHGGGTLPFLGDRLSAWASARPDLAARLPDGPLAELKRLNVDTASVTNAPALAALQAFLGPDKILFGTDYPFVGTLQQHEELVRNVPDARVRSAIEHSNARRLIPRLKTGY